MLDKSATDAIRNSAGITQALEAIEQATTTLDDGNGADHRVIALPDNFNIHDLEHYMPQRRRARGAMETQSITDFAAYVKAHAENGCHIFVQTHNGMSATAVLNLGTPTAPGHADNRAKLAPKATAAFTALKLIANGSPKTQKDVAEWMEDWAPLLTCIKDETEVETKKAVAAVRKMSIEAMKKVESSEQSLSAQRSAFESVAATSADPLPTTIFVKAVPHAGMDERVFAVRLSVLTTDKPAIVLRITKLEEHEETMGKELATRISAEIDDTCPVMLGSYSAA